MIKRFDDIQLINITGGNGLVRPDETIHPGDRFKSYIQVFEVIEFVERNKKPEYDVFRCKFWGSYGRYANGKEYDSIETYYRCQLESKERF